MSRNDPIYMKVDLDILEGEKFSQLTPNERDTFVFGLWRKAVLYRKTTVIQRDYNGKATVKQLGKDRRTTNRHYVRFHNIGLVTIYECGSITVHRVRECHARLAWKDDATTSPYGAKPLPRTLPPDFPIERIVREYESKREEDNSSSPGNSPNTKTSSASNHQDDENPEVSPKGEQESGSSPPSTKEDIPSNQHSASDPITSLAQFKAARPADPETVATLAFEVIDSLSLPDESHLEVEELIAGYPIAWTRDCILTVRDKQQRIAEGTDTSGFTNGPLQYLAGSLTRKLEALRHTVKFPDTQNNP